MIEKIRQLKTKNNKIMHILKNHHQSIEGSDGV